MSGHGPIGRMVANGRLASMVLWGPPGGAARPRLPGFWRWKRTLEFEPLSAVFSGVSRTFARCLNARLPGARAARAPCCSLMRFTASTEPSRTVSCPMWRTARSRSSARQPRIPSFEINAALLSRSQVFVLNRLDDVGSGGTAGCAARRLKDRIRIPVDADARLSLKAMADGDGRYLLNLAEELFALASRRGARHGSD